MATNDLSKEDRQRLADGLFLDLSRKFDRKTSSHLTADEKRVATEEYEATLSLFQQIVKGAVCPCCGSEA